MKKQVVVKTRLGNIVYGTGMVGAAICIFFAVDSVWVHETGKSLLQFSGRYEARDDASIGIFTGVALAAMSWGIGAVMRSFVNKSAEMRAAEIETTVTIE